MKKITYTICWGTINIIWKFLYFFEKKLYNLLNKLTRKYYGIDKDELN